MHSSYGSVGGQSPSAGRIIYSYLSRTFTSSSTFASNGEWNASSVSSAFSAGRSSALPTSCAPALLGRDKPHTSMVQVHVPFISAISGHGEHLCPVMIISSFDFAKDRMSLSECSAAGTFAHYPGKVCS